MNDLTTHTIIYPINTVVIIISFSLSAQQEEYNKFASRYLTAQSIGGGPSSSRRNSTWQSPVIAAATRSERHLVWAADKRRMPPVRRHGKIIRPSSAQAKLQSGIGSGAIGSSTGLDESNARPATAAPGLYGASGKGRHQGTNQQQNKSKSFLSGKISLWEFDQLYCI